MNTADYYQLLGVSRFATQDALRRAYHLRVRELHPDLNPDNAAALGSTRAVIEAYTVLSNPDTRRTYDLSRSEPTELYSVPARRARARVPEWVSRAMTAVAGLVVIIYVVLMSIQAILGASGPVFRPDVSLLREQPVTKSFPLLVPPDLSDNAAWYAANQYQLSFASDWATRNMIREYSRAADRAARVGDSARAEFYRYYIREALAARAARVP